MNNKDKKHENKPKKYRSVYSLENDEATVVWIVVMLVGTIFRDNWLIWIVATIWYIDYIGE